MTAPDGEVTGSPNAYRRYASVRRAPGDVASVTTMAVTPFSDTNARNRLAVARSRGGSGGRAKSVLGRGVWSSPVDARRKTAGRSKGGSGPMAWRLTRVVVTMPWPPMSRYRNASAAWKSIGRLFASVGYG